MSVLYRKDCKICKHRNHFRSTKCKLCKSSLTHSPGRPTGTTASEGSDVSLGRPTGTTASEGSDVSLGRPTGTTASEGSDVSLGRPTGITASEGYDVPQGRPTGTTASEGYDVSQGRPTGTTASEGYDVSQGRPTGTTVTVSEGYKTGQSGRSLGKKKHFLVICPVSGIHQLLTLLMTSSLNASPALSNKGSLIGNP